MTCQMWRDLINASELEFLAENYLIEIIPSFHEETISLVSGKYGPFKPNKIIKIPLWLAVKYRNNNQCKIIIPSTYENSYLKRVLDIEKENKESLFDLPPNFFEISNILFNNAENDFEDIKKTRCYVADIKAVRRNKINSMLKDIHSDELKLKLNGLTSMELEQIRPLLKSIFPMRLDIYNGVPVHLTTETLINSGAEENNIKNENEKDDKKDENSNEIINTNRKKGEGFNVNGYS